MLRLSALYRFPLKSGKGESLPQARLDKLGLVGENSEQWEPVIKRLAEEGVTLELVKFADYTLPNRALQDKEIDLNAFQHYAFLNNQSEALGLDLSAVGTTLIAPLGLYSQKIKSVDELKEGDKVALPNDATNGGRALKVLETTGLIAVDPEAGYLPEVSDITENKLNLEFVEVEAAQTAGLLPDVAAAFINGGHAVDNGYFPAKDAILIETVAEGSDNPYVNILVARTADKDNPLYQRILEVYLNVAEFDDGVFGIQAAAQHYFDVDAKDLTALQAARLAAVLPDPKNRSASKPSSFVKSRTRQIIAGAETIAADGRSACFED